MKTRRGRLLCLLVILATALVAGTAGPFLKEVQVQGRLSETRASESIDTRKAAYLWLLERDPARLLKDLVSSPKGRVITITGDYIRSDRREVSLVPMIGELYSVEGEVDRVGRLWNDACLRDEGFARESGEMLGSLMRDKDLDPALCHALNLLNVGKPGIRRASYLWLVTHADFPLGYDWESPNSVQEAGVVGPRISPATRKREEMVEDFVRARRAKRP